MKTLPTLIKGYRLDAKDILFKFKGVNLNLDLNCWEMKRGHFELRKVLFYFGHQHLQALKKPVFYRM